MAEQTPDLISVLHQPPSTTPNTAEEDVPAPPAATAVEDELEPPLASANIEVAVSAPAAVTVVEKDVPLSLAQPAAALAEEKVSVAPSDKDVSTSRPLSAALAEAQVSEFPVPCKAEATIDGEKSKPDELKRGPISWASFKEESNKVADLSDLQRKALEELKSLIQEVLNTRTFTTPLTQKAQETPYHSSSEAITQEAEEAGKSSEVTSLPEKVSIWGVPLMEDDRTDLILLKFLRARDFDVRKAFVMLKNTIIWRKEYNVDGLIDEELGDDLEKVVFMHGHDKEGHPVCYNVYGEFQNKDLYNKTFADEEKRRRFLRWRIQFLERSVRKLDFRPGGINTIFQVSDLKNSPGPGKRELRIATRQALQLLQDNYPEFVAKQVFVNVPWWYLAFYTMISPFLTQRTKSKFVFAGPARTAETLFKYISPEQVPLQYGGLSVDFCECNPEFTIDDPAPEITIKPATKQTVEIIVNEKCILVWELRVVGWEVNYSAEYVPSDKGGYTVIIQKPRRMSPTDEPVVSSSFKIVELGKILLTIDNPTTKKKKLLYRFKVVPNSI
ncbi:hypothetical protein ACH5RR_026194 [Cinchona calisaya]|uniref:Patellin-3 n=1 Tax=Cinchona calisaya TaxID=153742 RepID=A0ABD2Z1U7_9GENT